MKKTITFQKPSQQISLTRSIAWLFPFVMVDSALIGKPEEERWTSPHQVIVSIPIEIALAWGFHSITLPDEQARSADSYSLMKIMFEYGKRYIIEKLEKTGTLELEERLNLDSTNTDRLRPFDPFRIDEPDGTRIELEIAMSKSETTNAVGEGNSPEKLDIFISHSNKDEDLVGALVELLRSALSIPANRIRCTSVDGYRLPPGERTEDHLRTEILNSKVFIGVITPLSTQSQYVLFELGARWGAKLTLMPLLAAGATPGFLPGPLFAYSPLSCDNRAQLIQLIETVAGVLEKIPDSGAAYQKQLDIVVEKSLANKEKSDSEANAKKVSGPEADSRMYNETDIRSMLRVYLRSMPTSATSNEILVQFKDVAAQLHLPLETVKKHLYSAAIDAGFGNILVGEETVFMISSHGINDAGSHGKSRWKVD